MEEKRPLRFAALNRYVGGIEWSEVVPSISIPVPRSLNRFTSSYRDAKRINEVLDQRIKEDRLKFKKSEEVLLLGSPNSGKSTILKQMRAIHDVQWTPEEIETFRQQIFEDITYGLRNVWEATQDFELKLLEQNVEYLPYILQPVELGKQQPFPIEYYEPLKKLWDDPRMQRAWGRRNEADFRQNLSYFYSNLERLFLPDYTPTAQDIIRTRTRTTRLQETAFRLADRELKLIDLGGLGQTCNIKKWIHHFQDSWIFFVVSLNDYDQRSENRSCNQMQLAMNMWKSIFESRYIIRPKIILFLNKVDLFREKIVHSDIRNTFPDYEGAPGDFKQGLNYFRRRFLQIAKQAGPSRTDEIYVHYINATDEKQFPIILTAVKDIILTDRLTVCHCFGW